MFERFTKDAREAVVGAQHSARELGHRKIGTEHLLLGIMDRPTGVSRRVLEGCGLNRTEAAKTINRLGGSGDTGTIKDVKDVKDVKDDDLDAAALEAIGIDLDTVRQKVEAIFGPGALDRDRPRGAARSHIPFSPRAKKVLELSLREAIRLRQKEINDGHLLLGIIREGEGLAAKVIAGAGIGLDDLRDRIEHELR